MVIFNQIEKIQIFSSRAQKVFSNLLYSVNVNKTLRIQTTKCISKINLEVLPLEDFVIKFENVTLRC